MNLYLSSILYRGFVGYLSTKDLNSKHEYKNLVGIPYYRKKTQN